MGRKTCDLLLPEDTSGHYIWLVWDFKDSLIAIFKIYSVISWRQDYRHMLLMSLGLAVKTRLRPPRNSSQESFQNKKVSMESFLYPVVVVNNTMVVIVLFRVKHKRAPTNIMNVRIYNLVYYLYPLPLIEMFVIKQTASCLWTVDGTGWARSDFNVGPMFIILEIKPATCSQLLK